MGCINAKKTQIKHIAQQEQNFLNNKNKYITVKKIPKQSTLEQNVLEIQILKQLVILNNYFELNNPQQRTSYFSKKQENFLLRSNLQSNKQKNLKYGNLKLQKKKFIIKGGNALIYKAFSQQIQKFVIIKEIIFANLTNQEIQQLLKEKQFLSQNYHPYLIQFYGFNQSTQGIEIYIEYCQKGSLKEYLKKEKYITENKVQVFIKEILLGLQYIHSQGYIHRDIKLENIAIDKNNNIKIIDFGTIQKIGSKTNLNLGTLNYQSPETLQDQQIVIERSADIWSLGCITYEMLTGQILFKNQKHKIETINKILNFEHDIDKIYKKMSCSELAKHFIKSCLIKNPQQRYNCFELLQHPFLNQSCQELYSQNLHRRQKSKKKTIIHSRQNLQALMKKQSTFSQAIDSTKNFSQSERKNFLFQLKKSMQDFQEELKKNNNELDSNSLFTYESIIVSQSQLYKKQNLEVPLQ